MVIRGNSTLSITLPKMCEVKSTLRTRSLGFNSTISTGTAMSNLCTPGESYSYLQVTREVHRVFASTLDYSEDSLDSQLLERSYDGFTHGGLTLRRLMQSDKILCHLRSVNKEFHEACTRAVKGGSQTRKRPNGPQYGLMQEDPVICSLSRPRAQSKAPRRVQ